MMWDIAGGIVMAVIALNLLSVFIVAPLESLTIITLAVIGLAVLFFLLISGVLYYIWVAIALGLLALAIYANIPIARVRQFNNWMETRRLGKRIV
jgi:hypothetical protein